MDTTITPSPKTFKRITVENVFEEVCKIFRQSPEMVKSGCRLRKYLFCRYIISYVSYQVCRTTLTEIAELLGSRDHSSIHTSNKKVMTWIKDKEPTFMEYWNEYTEQSIIWNNYIKQ